MTVFENNRFQISIDESASTFSIQPKDERLPLVTGNHLSIKGKTSAGHVFHFKIQLNGKSPDPQKKDSSSRICSYHGSDEKTRISWKINFALPDQQSLVLWQIELTNRSSQPVFIDQINLLEPSRRHFMNVIFPQESGNENLTFYSNGWQSWSYTATYRTDQRMRRSRLGILQEPMVLNPGTPKYCQKGRFSADFFGVLGNRASRTALLLGFLSQKNHFGSLAADLRYSPSVRLWANGDGARLDPEMSVATDWAVLHAFHLDQPDPLSPYLDAVAEEHAIRELPASPAGWCSWYYYYQNISDTVIRENLDQIKAVKNLLPLNLVQIDDGFQAQVGDWLEFNANFPNGIEPLAREIKASGFTPGLWLAPFIVHPASRLAEEHPDWLLRRSNGQPARAGFVWNSLGLALDLTVPAAMEYTCQVLDAAVHKWGFPYLKLDFLYAAALKGKYHDGTSTRAQVLRKGMEAMRRTVGEDTFLLGCGAPLGSVLGLVQAMRIGADVSGYWKPTYFGISFPFKREPHMPSARNSIQNILTRAPLHQRWWINDPDCLLVRPDSDLNIHEIRSLATAIGLTGGSVLLSDKMQALPRERLTIAAALLPTIKQRIQVLDWMDAETPGKLRLDLQGAVGDWHVLAYFNWKDNSENITLRAEDFRLPVKDYYVHSFWDQTLWQAKAGQAIYTGSMPAHSVVLLALREYMPERAIYLGSNVHISQGLEISSWKSTKDGIQVGFSPNREVSVSVDIMLPLPPKNVLFNSKPITWELIAENIFRFQMVIPQKGELLIRYK